MRPNKQRPMEVFAESGSSSSSSDESENEVEDSTPQVKNEIKEEEQEEEQEEQEEEQEQHETTTTTTPPKKEEEVENVQGNLIDTEDKDDEEEDAEFDDAVKEEETTTADNNNALSLFGEQDDDDDDDDDAEFDDTGVKGSSRRPDDEETEDKMEYQSDVDSADEIEELRSRTLEALDYPKPTKSTMHMTKLPNLLKINPNAFDVSTFNADEEEKEYSGNVHGLIRWRYKTDPATGEFIRDENNRLVRESNARFVRWSDGSLTLHVNEESFDIDEIKSKPPEEDKEQNVESGNGIFPGLNGYLCISQVAWNKGKGQTMFKGLGPITSKLNARPSSINSEAHRNASLAVRQKNFKKARIEEFNVIQDPEKEKNKRIKNKDDLFKSENRSSSSYSRTTNRSSNSGYNQRRRNKYSMEERNYDSVNISALKRMNEDMMNVEESGVYDYGSAGSASDDDWEQKKLLDFKKARKGERKVVEEEEEEEEENMNQEDSDDDEEGKMMSQRRNRNRAVVDEDDED